MIADGAAEWFVPIGAEGLLPGAKNRDQSVPSRNYAVGRDATVPQIFAHDEERAARISDSDLQVASDDALAQEDQTAALDPIVWLRHKQMGLMFLGIGSRQYPPRADRPSPSKRTEAVSVSMQLCPNSGYLN
jgi:hypothetical protein